MRPFFPLGAEKWKVKVCCYECCFAMLIISAPQCDITSSCVDSNVANILTCSLMETVEAKLEVNVAKSIDNTFSQEIGNRFESPAPLFKRCLAFLRPFDIRYSDKQRKTQREIRDILDELSRCYARDIVYVTMTMDGKDRNF